MQAIKQQAIEGTYEVFHRPEKGDGFIRCGHAHATENEAWTCMKEISRKLYTNPMPRRRGYDVHIATVHIHPGGPWHKPGEVVGVDAIATHLDGLPIWEKHS